MSISDLRLERVSLINYIKHEILPVNFSEQLEEDLVYSSTYGGYVAETSMDPSPTSRGRGWVIFDDNQVGNRTIVDTTEEQTEKVSVIGATSYTLDYIHGVIKNPDSVPTSVSYFWHYVSVINSWPFTTPPPLPVVCIEIEGHNKTGFQLGGGEKRIRDVRFSIFASSSQERDDLSETIYNALFNKNIVINDFSDGDYLNYDGTFNTGVSPSNLNNAKMWFTRIRHNNINVWSDFSDLNKYRSEVVCSYESFVDNPY